MKIEKKPTVEVVDTTKLTSIELVDAALCTFKDDYVRKAKHHDTIKEAKNDIAASYREQLKEIKEELDGLMANIRSLEDHRKLINMAADGGIDLSDDEETEERVS